MKLGHLTKAYTQTRALRSGAALSNYADSFEMMPAEACYNAFLILRSRKRGRGFTLMIVVDTLTTGLYKPKSGMRRQQLLTNSYLNRSYREASCFSAFIAATPVGFPSRK